MWFLGFKVPQNRSYFFRPLCQLPRKILPKGLHSANLRAEAGVSACCEKLRNTDEEIPWRRKLGGFERFAREDALVGFGDPFCCFGNGLGHATVELAVVCMSVAILPGCYIPILFPKR